MLNRRDINSQETQLTILTITSMSLPELSERPQSFANELLILIIDHCQNDAETLHALSLVNTLFHNFSQPLLYRQITSSRPSHHATFFHTLTRKPHLAKYVRRYDSSRLTEDMDQVLWGTTLYMIGQMPNLEHLGLRIHRVFRATSLFNNIAYAPAVRLDSTHFRKFKLRSLRFRRNNINPRLEQGWWTEFIRAQAQTLEVLDLGGITQLFPWFVVDEPLGYPKLKVVQGEWQVFQSLGPRKRLRVMDVTGDIDTNVFSSGSIVRELSELEGFCSRFVGPYKQKAEMLLSMVQCLHSVKYLGIAHEIRDIANLKNSLKMLPLTGLHGLQAITLLWNEKWKRSSYENIDATPFIDIFKMCPELRLIDIEMPDKDWGESPISTSTYCRIECKKPGQMYQYRYFSFQAEAVFQVCMVNRTQSTVYFE
ncbi:hypothetical protein BJ165DRAFT_1494687 [Panaeolus papilionaceus]|nr:hypothetical protein BJ165DRAFT_1494687 [Panaeolus papilionaceus]